MTDLEVINNIKSLSIDMIKNAGSGHSGIVLGAAPLIYTLYAYHLNVNAADPHWFNRDRFVLSAGHGSAMLYATLFLAGFNLKLDDLKQFRHLGSKTPGHPEVRVTEGVECSTGPLGQGLATAVGMALGEKILNTKYKIDDHSSLVDYKVYVLAGDGDLMEGISYEAASLAGTLKLNNLIVLYDSNDVSLDGPTNKAFTENVRGRFEALNWTTYHVKDGNNITELNKVLNKAHNAHGPVLIEVKTKIGEGSLLEGSNAVHGKCLDDDDIKQLKGKLGMPAEAFFYQEEALQYLRSKISDRVNNKYKDTNNLYNAFVGRKCSGDKTLASYLFSNKFNYDLLSLEWPMDAHQKEATRDSNTMFLKYLSKNLYTFVGGSADLGSSTKTYVSDLPDVTASNYAGSNIWFGVREHAMGAILNGLALVNLKPYGSTFLSFADYMKPAIRMSALMHLPVTYIFSHDSILVGPDGPTHQPVEQLAMLRSIPNMKVFRPADVKELLGCWQVILNTNTNPSALILSRTEVATHQNTNAKMATYGGYLYYKEQQPLKAVIIASGTELVYARNIGYELATMGHQDFRIVSMPSIEQFLATNKEYQKQVIPDGVTKIVIEAGSSFGWHRLSNDHMNYITIDDFGASGTKDEVLKHMNYDYETVKARVFEIMDIH